MNAEDYHNRGNAKAAKGDFDGAIADFNEAIRLKLDFEDAFFNRGNAKTAKGDLDGAIADFDAAIHLKPDYVDAFLNRGNAKADKGNLDGAIKDFNEAIRLKPDYVDAFLNRGNAKADKGDLDGTIADYDEAIRLKPDYVVAFNNRGAAKAVKGDLDGAIADYDEAIRLKPASAEAFNNRGNAKADKGDLDGAIADYDEAIRLKPDYVEAFNNRGIAKAVKGDLDGAIADFNEAIRLKPDHVVAFNNRGIAKAVKGDLDGAIADFNEAIRLKPDHVVAFNNRGNAKRSKGDLDGAIADFNEAIRLKPDYVAAFFNRGNAKRSKGDLDEAIADYLQANSLDSKLTEKYIELWFIKGLKENERRQFFVFWSKILKLQGAVLKGDVFNAMHYTDLDTLHNIVDGKRFRLYHSSNMADSSEGKVFFDLLGLTDDEKATLEKDIYGARDSYTYIGSFVTDSDNDIGDSLMWRTYGKHNGTESAGCALVYKNFSKVPHDLSPISLESRELASEGKKPPKTPIPDTAAFDECRLFPVIYCRKNQLTEKNGEIADALKDLGCSLKKMQGSSMECKECIAISLDLVRYLFKDVIYTRECEARLIIWRGPKAKIIKREPPRRYIECPPEFKPSHVILGPEAAYSKDWQGWGNKKGFEIISSRYPS